MNKYKLIITLSLGLILSVNKAYAQEIAPTPTATPLVADRVVFDSGVHFVTKNFSQLDADADEYVKNNIRTVEGNWAIARLFVGIGSRFAYFPEYVPTLDEWIKQNPKSPHAHVAKANYLKALAWQKRGSGYAAASSDKQLKEFTKISNEALGEAEKALKLLPSHPEALNLKLYFYLLNNDKRVSGFIESALKMHPTYFPLYATINGFLRPQWRGNYNIMESFAAQSAEEASKQKADEADYVYAYLADNASSELGERLYSITPFQWERVKTGFSQELVKFPGSLVYARLFMLHAWYAGDKITASNLLKKYGDTWSQELVENFQDQTNFEKFKSWAYSPIAGVPQKTFTVHDAVVAGDLNRIKFLLASGTDINLQNEQGQTPLMVAILTNKKDIALELIKQKADLSIEDKNGYTAAHCAVLTGDLSLLEPLKASFSEPMSHKFSVSHLAAQRGQVEMLKEIVRLSPTLMFQVDSEGNTPLIYAILSSRTPMIHYIIEKDMMSRQMQGRKDRNMPLHLAAKMGDMETVKALLAVKVIANMQNADNKTAADLARENNHPEIADLIVNTKMF